MKEKMKKMFKDKLFLVMPSVRPADYSSRSRSDYRTKRKGNETNPYPGKCPSQK